MPPHTSTHFEIQKHYQNEPKCNSDYSRNNQPSIKDRAYVINLDEDRLIETHWIALYANSSNIVYLDVLQWNFFQKKLKNL